MVHEKKTFKEFRVVDAQIKRETKGPWNELACGRVLDSNLRCTKGVAAAAVATPRRSTHDLRASFHQSRTTTTTTEFIASLRSELGTRGVAPD